MKKKATETKTKVTLYDQLRKRAFPASLAAALVTIAAWGMLKTADLLKIKNYAQWEAANPKKVVAQEIVDGDTFKIDDGRFVRLIITNAPDVGEKNHQEAKEYLTKLIKGKTVWLEYDRYQNDKFNRILAWVWMDCETEPTFAPYNYMIAGYNRSRETGLTDNPEGCKKGTLVDEEMIRVGLAKAEPLERRGKLKYEDRIIE